MYIPEIKTKNVSESPSNMGTSISVQPNDGKTKNTYLQNKYLFFNTISFNSLVNINCIVETLYMELEINIQL